MAIKKTEKFIYNKYSKKDYIFALNNVKKKNVNILGLYRSITENNKLNLEDKIEVLGLINEKHYKTFEFYQIQYPDLYIELFTLGKNYNEQQLSNLWEEIQVFQEKKLKEKKFGHRNFGDYSKHLCGIKECPVNGMMIKANSGLSETCLTFKSDSNKLSKKNKSQRLKTDRHSLRKIIDESIEGY